MSIDFNKFVGPKEVIVPIVDGCFQYNRKKYTMCDAHIYGWYKVKLNGNECGCIEGVSPEIEFPKAKTIKGYTYNNNLIFQNFDVGKRKLGIDMMTVLHFNTAPTFSAVKAILWEDNCLYYYSVNYEDAFIYDVKSEFDNDRSIIEKKGVTPELKTLYLFHSLEKEAIRKADEKVIYDKKVKEWAESLPGRLALAFGNVGSKVLEYSITGNRLFVDWQLEETGRTYNSVLDASTFQTIEAGFCTSGGDRKFNVTSMVLTAKEYERERVTYITRRNKEREGWYYDDEVD